MSETSIKDLKDKLLSLDSLISELGCLLVNVLHATLKVAAIYDSNNNRYLSQVAKLKEILNEIFSEEPDFSLLIKDGYFFVSDIRLAVDPEIQAAKTYFLEQWPSLGISGFSFNHRMEQDELDRFILFISHYKMQVDALDNLQLLKDGFNKLRIINIVPIQIFEGKQTEEKQHKNPHKENTRKIFFATLSVIKDTLGQVSSSGRVNTQKIKRVVQQLVGQIIDDEASLMEMTALHNFDDYTYVHSVNVCILSLVLGYHLGLDRRRLSNLGVGALLHDIGKTKLSKNLINKPANFNEYDWRLMHKHPIYGLKVLLMARPADETTSRAAAAIFEHHMRLDGTGYPQLPNKRDVSLFAKIVTITDTYNAMTSGRVYHKKRHLPDETITHMVHRAGKSFDPYLLKTFINIIGVYPIGTVVELSSKEIGIVTKNNPENLEKPQVKVIANEGGPFDRSEVKIMDLSQEPGINVNKIIDDDKFNINIASYLEIG